MLRAAVLGFGLLLLAAAVVVAILFPAIWPASLEFGIFGGLVVIGTVFERRYRGGRAGAGWKATGERFIDPTSGKLVEVRTDPATGARAYVDVDAK